MLVTTINLEKELYSLPNLDYRLSDMIFFDIETTGFSSSSASLYLIGCIYFEDSFPKLIQWLAESAQDEISIISAFFEFISPYKVLVNYNGNGFDIPFLLKKVQYHRLPYTLNPFNSLDLYRAVAPYKKFLKLESLKQKSIEMFLDITREDQYSGGELISFYHSYLKKPHNYKELEYLLLLHNQDDLKGLVLIFPILSYPGLFQGRFEVTSLEINEELIFSISLEIPLPKQVSKKAGSLYFSGYGNHAKVKVPVYTGELKYFHPNYQDYYYLPIEDTAIHKSIASFVDKNYRTKAKAANCYSKKTGSFLPGYSELTTPCFKTDYASKVVYFELTSALLDDKGFMKKYLLHLLEELII